MFLPEPHKNIKFLTKGRGRETKNNNNKNKRSRKKKASRTIHIYSCQPCTNVTRTNPVRNPWTNMFSHLVEECHHFYLRIFFCFVCVKSIFFLKSYGSSAFKKKVCQVSLISCLRVLSHWLLFTLCNKKGGGERKTE